MVHLIVGNAKEHLRAASLGISLQRHLQRCDGLGELALLQLGQAHVQVAVRQLRRQLGDFAEVFFGFVRLATAHGLGAEAHVRFNAALLRNGGHAGKTRQELECGYCRSASNTNKNWTVRKHSEKQASGTPNLCQRGENTPAPEHKKARIRASSTPSSTV